MKVIVDRKPFVSLVKLVGSVLPRRAAGEHAHAVLLLGWKPTGGERMLEVRTVNPWLGMRAEFMLSDVLTPGAVFVSHEALTEALMEEVPTLTLDCDDGVLHVRGDADVFKLFTHNAGDAAGWVGAGENVKTYNVEPTEFGALLGSIDYAVAKENSRYAINGLLLRVQRGKLTGVATDGRRMAVSTMKADGADADGIIPMEAIAAVQRVLKLHPQSVTVEVGEVETTDPARPKVKRSVFRFGGIAGCGVVEVCCEHVDGSFPPYEDVIPANPCLMATVEVEGLASACKAACKWTNEESRGMKLSIDLGKASMAVSTRAPERGEWGRTLQLARSQTYNGSSMDIGFNPRFVADILKTIDVGEVTLSLTAPGKPMLIASGAAKHVLMPITLG